MSREGEAECATPRCKLHGGPRQRRLTHGCDRSTGADVLFETAMEGEENYKGPIGGCCALGFDSDDWSLGVNNRKKKLRYGGGRPKPERGSMIMIPSGQDQEQKMMQALSKVSHRVRAQRVSQDPVGLSLPVAEPRYQRPVVDPTFASYSLLAKSILSTVCVQCLPRELVCSPDRDSVRLQRGGLEEASAKGSGSKHPEIDPARNKSRPHSLCQELESRIGERWGFSAITRFGCQTWMRRTVISGTCTSPSPV